MTNEEIRHAIQAGVERAGTPGMAPARCSVCGDEARSLLESPAKKDDWRCAKHEPEEVQNARRGTAIVQVLQFFSQLQLLEGEALMVASMVLNAIGLQGDETLDSLAEAVRKAEPLCRAAFPDLAANRNERDRAAGRVA